MNKKLKITLSKMDQLTKKITDPSKYKQLMQNYAWDKKYNTIHYLDELSTTLSPELGLVPRPVLELVHRNNTLSLISFLSQSDIRLVILTGIRTETLAYLAALFPKTKFIVVEEKPFNIVIKEGGKTQDDIKTTNIIYLTPKKETLTDRMDFSTNKIITEDRVLNETEIKTLSDSWDNLSTTQLIKFILTTSYQVLLIERPFYLKLATKLSPLTKFAKIGLVVAINDDPDYKDIDLIRDQARGYILMKAIKANRTMFKIRPPIMDERQKEMVKERYELYLDDFKMAKTLGIDFVNNYLNNKWILPQGRFTLQPWIAKCSTTGFLEIGQDSLIKNKLMDIDVKTFISKYNFYNSIIRGFAYHTRYDVKVKVPGLCNCNDCGLETAIWHNYNLQPWANFRYSGFIRLTDFTREGLNVPPHGLLVEPLNKDIFLEMVELLKDEVDRPC